MMRFARQLVVALALAIPSFLKASFYTAKALFQFFACFRLERLSGNLAVILYPRCGRG
jgi:hypothetical protein